MSEQMLDAERLMAADKKYPKGPPLEIAEYKPTEAALAALRDRFMGVIYEVATTEGMKAAKEARNEIRGYRTSLEKKRKELKEPALRRSKLIDEEAKLLTERIVALEQPIAIQIEAEEQRIDNERKAREDAETRRVQELLGRLNEIKLAPARVTGRPAASIEIVLASLTDRVIGPEFAEFQREAEGERVVAISMLTTMLAGAKAQEEEAAKVFAEREELERLRRERAELEAKQEADRKARIAAEEATARTERERLDREAAEERARLYKLAQEQLGSPEPSAIPSVIPAIADCYPVLLAAMHTLREIVLPGSAEAEIIENALRRVGEN